MDMAAPHDGEQIRKIELSTAQDTSAAELELEALENREGARCMGPSRCGSHQSEQSLGSNASQRAHQHSPHPRGGGCSRVNTKTVDAVVVTADGDQPLLMVLDEDEKLLAWKRSQQVQPIEATD